MFLVSYQLVKCHLTKCQLEKSHWIKCLPVQWFSTKRRGTIIYDANFSHISIHWSDHCGFINLLEKKLENKCRNTFKLIMNTGLYSQHFIFFATYEWAQKARVLVTGKPFRHVCSLMLQLIGPMCKLRRKWNAVNMVSEVIFTTINILHKLQIGPIC